MKISTIIRIIFNINIIILNISIIILIMTMEWKYPIMWIEKITWYYGVNLNEISNIWYPATADITAPSVPTLTSTPITTTLNSINVEVNWEIWASIFVNWVSTWSVISWAWKTTIALNTSWSDWVKTFSITLKDITLNTSPALTVNITKTTVSAPLITSMSWFNSGWYIPESQWTIDTWMILKANTSLTWSAISSLTSNWWTISSVSINWSWNLTFNYTTPFTDPDTLILIWYDSLWRYFNITLSVDLPF